MSRTHRGRRSLFAMKLRRLKGLAFFDINIREAVAVKCEEFHRFLDSNGEEFEMTLSPFENGLVLYNSVRTGCLDKSGL